MKRYYPFRVIEVEDKEYGVLFTIISANRFKRARQPARHDCLELSLQSNVKTLHQKVFDFV